MIYFAKWKVILVCVVCAFGVLFTVPNFLDTKDADSMPKWLPHQQVVLGLDLQGGSHLLMEVAVGAVIKERLETLVDSVRTALRKERIRYQGLGAKGNAISVTIRTPDKEAVAQQLIREIGGRIANPSSGGLVPGGEPGFTVEKNERGQIVLSLTERTIRDWSVNAVEQSIEIVRRRIDETGVREPTIQRQGTDRILVQLPGVDDPERIKRLLGKTAKMTFHLTDPRVSAAEAMAGRVPPGAFLAPSVDERDPSGQSRMYLLRKRTMVSGENLVDSQPSFDSRTNEPVVTFRFDSVGARRFGDVTSKSVGKVFAIVLDGKVISAPVIREPILGGSGQISGSFSVQGARDLALLLRAGALPAPLTILEERTVGPGLGADSIAAGKIASIVGLVFVVVFMVVAYGLFGLIADIALFFNMILILGVLSFLQATLTLPGIAGIVLTIGMAVDANVLIFERIREEVRIGRTPISAIEAGYSRAITTIVDANLTTLIAALLLYQFGSGPIRGFAVTLSVGIATSMFTAIMLTRLLVVTWLRRRQPQELPI
ncbi:MAG: protein translocase subunit SecD [Rhodospirillales bacterium]